jgi:glutamate-1-semialdehyde 2,1-aminomutase
MSGGASAALFERACAVTPGGVNSPVRAFRRVGGEPFFVRRGHGARIEDVDGRSYIDFVMSWGALMLGHAHPAIVEAVGRAAPLGTSYGAPCAAEVELAEAVCARVPSVEMVRFVNSGTEATMSAVRLARAATGRDGILKFSGCYHGHGDAFLVQAGSGVATLGLPDSPGVPAAFAALTRTVPFNDVAAVRTAFDTYGAQLACVIVEPVVGNAGFILPDDGFLPFLREVTTEYGALLVLDEVMTGFRVAPGGAQERFGVMPDLTTLGKVIGGGLPVGAYGGTRALMERIAPAGPVYQAGTLSGNPLAMAAGLAQLRILEETRPHDLLEQRARRLLDGRGAAARELGVPFTGGALGGMFGWFFTDGPVRSFEDAKRVDTELFARFFHAALARGVFLPASPYEAAFLSTAHGDDDIDRALDALRDALREAVR